MPPKRRTAKTKIEPVSEAAWSLMLDREPPPDANKLELLDLRFPATNFNEELWRTYGEDVLAEYIPANPCRRPSWWWLYSSPEPARRRLGGIGTPAHEALSFNAYHRHGIPEQWLQPADLAGDVGSGQVIDPVNPPVFESQAAYLQRHQLLTPAEVRHLGHHPELLEPEVLEIQKER